MPWDVPGTSDTRVDENIQFPPARGLQVGQEDSDPQAHRGRRTAVRDPRIAREGMLGRHGGLPGGRHDPSELCKVDRRRRRDAPKINRSGVLEPAHTGSIIHFSSQCHTQ